MDVPLSNQVSEIRGCKEWWRKMSINNRSNQTYHQLQINSQKAKPAHHRDPSNHSLPQRRRRLSPRGESLPPGISSWSRPKGSILHVSQAGCQQKANVRGLRAWPRARAELQGGGSRLFCQTAPDLNFFR